MPPVTTQPHVSLYKLRQLKLHSYDSIKRPLCRCAVHLNSIKRLHGRAISTANKLNDQRATSECSPCSWHLSRWCTCRGTSCPAAAAARGAVECSLSVARAHAHAHARVSVSVSVHARVKHQQLVARRPAPCAGGTRGGGNVICCAYSRLWMPPTAEAPLAARNLLGRIAACSASSAAGEPQATAPSSQRVRAPPRARTKICVTPVRI